MTDYTCNFCDETQNKIGRKLKFYSTFDFYNHLRESHCVKEGGSYVCLYGYNGVCPSLPIEGVSEVDYKDHVNKVHAHSSADHMSKIETDSNEKNWKTQNTSVNMAALLNNPRLTKRETDIFTKIWGEAFGRIHPIIPSPSIPSVSMNYFRDFIKNTCTNRTKGEEETKSTLQKKKNEVLGTRMHAQDPAIPKIFFKPDFDLTERNLFEAVIPWSSFKPPSKNPSSQSPLHLRDDKPNNNHKKLSNNLHSNVTDGFSNDGISDETTNSVKLLQEKLSHHLDNIEVQISKQICLKSHSFFQTMLSHYALHGHLENLCKSVHVLRERMEKISESMVNLPLNILQKTQRKRQYHRILQKLHLMATVQQTQPTIQLLLSTNDFSGCLDLISTTHEVLSQELSGLHCFRHFGPQLLEMEKVIVRMIEEEYTFFLTNFFNQPIDHSHIASTPSLPNIVTECKPMDQEKLVLIGLGLYRHNNTDYITTILNESQTTVKTLIKQTVIEVVSTLELSDSDKNLTAQVRMLSQQQWQLLLSKLFYVLLVVLLRVKSLIEVLALIGSRLVYESPKQDHNDSTSPQIIPSDENDESNNKQENDQEEKQRHENITKPILEDVNDNNLLEFMSEFDPVMLIDATHTEHTSTSVQPSSYNTTATEPAAELALNNLNNNSEPSTQRTLEQRNNSIMHEDVKDELRSCVMEGKATEDNDIGLSQLKLNDDAQEFSSDNDNICADFHLDSNWRQNISLMIKDCDPILSESELANINTKYQETLAQVLEFINHRTYKLFTIRDKQEDPVDRLGIEEFVEMACYVEWFLVQGERVVSCKCTPLLRGHMRNQALKFVNKFHDEKKDKLCLILDNERWKQADVPMQFQHLVHHIVSTDQMSSPPKEAELENKGGQEKLIVAGDEYVVVGTVLILLRLMVDYCEFAEQVPCVAAEILNKLVELLKSFNSRTCQLILGAGAVKLGGLKTINTINLGLASRCLQLVLFFLPKVKEHFQTRLFSKTSSIPETSKQQSLKQLDILIKDYNEHIGEISVKMVSIMDQAPINLIAKYDPKSSSSSQPSPIFESLSKRTLRFIEATVDLLPRHQLEAITSQFHSNFILNLSRHLTSLGFHKDSPYKNAIERDLKYYSSTMQQVEIFKDFSISIKDIITC